MFAPSQLVCPVLRCLSNLLAGDTGCQGQIRDERLLVALFLILQSFLQQHPFIVQEGLWLLNNLTGERPWGWDLPGSVLSAETSTVLIRSSSPTPADEPFFCSALLALDLLPALLQLLPCSPMAAALVRTRWAFRNTNPAHAILGVEAGWGQQQLSRRSRVMAVSLSASPEVAVSVRMTDRALSKQKRGPEADDPR